MKRLFQIFWNEAKGARSTFEFDRTILANEVESIRPASVILFGCIGGMIDQRRNSDSQFAHAS